MSEYLIITIPLALMTVGLLQHFIRHKQFLAWIIAVCLIVVMSWFGIANVSDWAWENKSASLIYRVSIVQAIIPVAILLTVSYIINQITDIKIKWIVGVGASVLFVAAWPYIALYIVCASKLDCV